MDDTCKACQHRWPETSAGGFTYLQPDRLQQQAGRRGCRRVRCQSFESRHAIVMANARIPMMPLPTPDITPRNGQSDNSAEYIGDEPPETSTYFMLIVLEVCSALAGSRQGERREEGQTRSKKFYFASLPGCVRWDSLVTKATVRNGLGTSDPSSNFIQLHPTSPQAPERSTLMKCKAACVYLS